MNAALNAALQSTEPGEDRNELVRIGRRVREARKARGMTQRDLAGRELTASFISQVERGLTAPSLKSLRLIADRLGLPMMHFLE